MKLEKYQLIEKDLEHWLNLFLEEKKISHSKNTIIAYEQRINKFIEYSYLERVNNNDEKLSIRDINRYFMLGFVNYLKDNNIKSTSTIKTYIDTLKSFFMYITENNEDAFDLTYAFKKISVKVEQKIKPSFSVDEVKKIENALIEALNKDLIFSKYRNYLMLFILLKTGMRGFEVINLKRNDLIEEGKYYKLKIKGKGNKERVNFLKKEEFKKFFENYFSKLLTQNLNTDFLFPNNNGKSISRFTLYNFNTRFLSKLLIKKTGLHIYRHTFARMMVAKKENLATISQWLGHSDISITHKYYARANEEDLKNLI